MNENTVCALEVARKFQSQQTHFIHYCHHHNGTGIHDTIPVYENFLFVLILLKCRRSEEVNEAKGYLIRLLAYQNEEGNFPIYLHEYPTTYNRTKTIQLLPILLLIQRDFGHILGEPLKSLFLKAIEKSVSCTLSCDSLPFALRYQSLVVVNEFGKLLKNEAWIATTQPIFDTLQDEALLKNDLSESTLSDLSLAISLAPEQKRDDLLSVLRNCWHAKTRSYVGPVVEERYSMGHPAPSFYKDFMETAVFGRVERDADLGLSTLSRVLLPENISWVFSDQDEIPFSYTLSPQRPDRIVYPLRILWGEHKSPNTLVCQILPTVVVEERVVDGKIVLDFTLHPFEETELKKHSESIAFYYNIHKGLQTRIEGVLATLFHIGETVEIKDDDITITLNTEVVEGTGVFTGHLMRGNRMTETENKGDSRYSVYDWKLFIRIVDLSTSSKLRVTVGVE